MGVGPYTEVLFFHRPSRTLLVTDMAVSVPREPPSIVQVREGRGGGGSESGIGEIEVVALFYMKCLPPASTMPP